MENPGDNNFYSPDRLPGFFPPSSTICGRAFFLYDTLLLHRENSWAVYLVPPSSIPHRRPRDFTS